MKVTVGLQQNAAKSVVPPRKNSSQNVSFGAAQVNILATSDNHGRFYSLPGFYSNIINNVKEIFPHATKTPESTVNLAIFGGDWFMDPAKGGYVTHPEKVGGDFQLEALRMLLDTMKGLTDNFRAFFIPGNHDYDGGDRRMFGYLSKLDMTTLLSNYNIENSPAITDLPEPARSKFVQSEIIKVPDDKDPNLVNHIMMMGVTIPGLDYYVPGCTDDTDIIGKCAKKDAKLTVEDLREVINALDDQIADFREKYPDGKIILNDHTSFKVTEKIIKNLKVAPNMVLDGHDHTDEVRVIRVKDGQNNYVKSVPVFSLWHDSEKFDAVKLHFDDQGYLDKFGKKSFYSSQARKIEDNPFTEYSEKSFAKDREPLLQINGPDDLLELSPVNVRKFNNHLANFLTDCILEEINQSSNPAGQGTEILCIGSAGIRHPFPVNRKTTNLNLRNTFTDPIETLSGVSIANMTGADIIDMTVENMTSHKENMDRNTMYQWSGVQIRKTDMIALIESGQASDKAKVAETIRVKNGDKYEPIDLNRSYKIAIPDYFFKRPKSTVAIKYQQEGKLTSLDKTLNDLFREYAIRHDYDLTMPETERRVVIEN